MTQHAEFSAGPITRDAIGWDVANWRSAIRLFDELLPSSLMGATALELGCGRNGGLSLWLANRGLRVICSGYPVVSAEARKIHHRYGVDDHVEYQRIDARSIPYRDSLDVVCFKSVLGGIDRDGTMAGARQVLAGAHRALKPGGWLLMAENLTATWFHAFLRRHFASGKDAWRYFELNELGVLLSDYELVGMRTFGFLGAMGRREWQRSSLAMLDRLLTRILPCTMHYAVAIVARKP